jgi:hypothetical protein
MEKRLKAEFYNEIAKYVSAKREKRYGQLCTM